MSAILKQVDERPNYEQLVSLLEAVRYMGNVRDLDLLLPYVAEHCIKALEADRCSIFLYDANKGEVWSRHVEGENKEIRFRIEKGIAGRCISAGESISTDDPYNHPYFNPDIDRDTGYLTRNLLCVPMKNIHDEIIGCFQVVNKKNGSFNRADETLLSAFGAQVAIAIESALLHMENVKVIDTLKLAEKRLTDALTQVSAVYEIEKFSSDPQSEMTGLITTALVKALEVIDGDCGAVFLRQLDGHTHFYGLRAAGNIQHLTLDQSELAPSGEKNPLKFYIRQSMGIEVDSILQVPILVLEESGGQELIGSMCVINHLARDFPKSDKTFLEIISRQISVVFEKHKLTRQKNSSERLAMVGRLVSSVVHDVRTPLSTISGISKIFEKSSNIEFEETQGYFEIIADEVARCNTMLEELLDFAAGRSRIHCVDVDMEEFLKTVSRSLKSQLGSSKTQLEIENNVVEKSFFDPNRLMRVIFNIANNAFAVLKGQGSFKVQCRKVDANLEIRLSDSGPGIPMKIRKSLFEPFVTYGKSEGTGLGMHIAKEIIHAHRGSIILEDTEVGASFLITIPFSENKSE